MLLEHCLLATSDAVWKHSQVVTTNEYKEKEEERLSDGKTSSAEI